MKLDRYRIPEGARLDLSGFDPNEHGTFEKSSEGKALAKEETRQLRRKIGALQSRLYAAGTRSVLVVLQGMDTSGKDGTIRRVLSGVNPQSCKVVSFKAPTPVELAHDFLWRVHREVPPKGHIGIFNRSHYEDVLIVRVHNIISSDTCANRLRQIREFEAMLHNTGTRIVKFFLYISKAKQKKRLETRIRNPEKRWKFNMDDLEERKLWEKYMTAFEEAISETTTTHAPWYVVPANRKWYRDFVVASAILETLEGLKLKQPKPAEDIDWDHLTID